MDKRTRILKEAAKLFAGKGFNETAASEIAQAADTAQGTVFYHFGTKQGILRQIYENMVIDYMEQLTIASEIGETGLENIRSIMEFHFRYAEENRAEFTVLHRDVPSHLDNDGNRCEIVKRNSEKSIGIIAAAIKRGIDDGSVRQDVNAENSAKILKAMLIGMTRMSNLHKVDFSSVLGTCIDFCDNALKSRG
ncbi:MAG: TetR/AcrR family transcriptional regulator [Deferribacterales bacterium]